MNDVADPCRCPWSPDLKHQIWSRACPLHGHWLDRPLVLIEPAREPPVRPIRLDEATGKTLDAMGELVGVTRRPN